MVGIPSEYLVYLVINTPNKTIIFKRVDSTTLEKLIIQRKISKKLSKIFLNKVYGWKNTHVDLLGFRENPEKKPLWIMKLGFIKYIKHLKYISLYNPLLL